MQRRELPTGWDRGLPVFPSDPKGIPVGMRRAVIRREHLEIGVAHRGDGRKNDDLLVEAAGDYDLLCGARGSAVFAPEVDLVSLRVGLQDAPDGGGDVE